MRQADPLPAFITLILDFLTELYQQGLGNSSLNTARSALSTFMCVDNNQSVGSHPLIKRFMKGVFSNRPALCATLYHFNFLPM